MLYEAGIKEYYSLKTCECSGERWVYAVKGRSGHRVYYRPDHRIVVVPFHTSGDTFPVGTLNSIFKSTGWTEEDFRRLGLLK